MGKACRWPKEGFARGPLARGGHPKYVNRVTRRFGTTDSLRLHADNYRPDRTAALTTRV